MAEARGQTLAQMALAWVLREGRHHLGADRRIKAGTGAKIAPARSAILISQPMNWPRSARLPKRKRSTFGPNRLIFKPAPTSFAVVSSPGNHGEE
jgi:hypothetical protein